jgi:hypothetical protein
MAFNYKSLKIEQVEKLISAHMIGRRVNVLFRIKQLSCSIQVHAIIVRPFNVIIVLRLSMAILIFRFHKVKQRPLNLLLSHVV